MRRSRRPRSFWRTWWWIVPLAVFDVFLFGWFLQRSDAPRSDEKHPGCRGPAPTPSVHEVVVPAPKPERAPLQFTYPTDQQNLMDTNSLAVYMPTASGRAESAWFGTVRTRQQGKHLLPSFHEGIDIAPLKRDRQGRALDAIYAAAEGTVAYANRVAGNSSYGCYVLLRHDDPLGAVYSLYAHLAEVDRAVQPGVALRAGTTIGRMGNTTTLGLPLARSHLHFEVGLLLNQRFDRWYRAKKLKPDHGLYHGWNVTGIDPLEVFRAMEEQGAFSMKAYLQAQPTAFELVVRASRPVDYFQRYPALWTGEGAAQGDLVLRVSTFGVILEGRPATGDESALLQGARWAVLRADREQLGRNGQRLVIFSGGTWSVGNMGKQWLEILLF